MNTHHPNTINLYTIKNWFRLGIYCVYKTCIEPKTMDEDSKRHEFILNTILCCIIPLLVIFDIFVKIASIQEGVSYTGISFFTFTTVVCIFIYLLILSRNGNYKISSLILLFLYFLGTTYGAITWSIVLPLVAISYVVIIVISSILISTKFSIYVTALTAITISVITYLQEKNVIIADLHWKHTWISMHEPIQLSIVLFLVAGISWLSNREMERSLQRARFSEHELLLERDLLEIKVDERTAELRKMQKDKVSQLYRFAEFGKLSTGIFHDLMNSLNIVVNNVERIETTREHLPEVKEHMVKAVMASRRMGNYIQSVRKQITHSDSLGIFSPAKEINDAVDIVQFKAREASVKIRIDIKAQIMLYGNALKFYQSVLNLLMNAIEACEEKVDEGLVEISLEPTIDNAAAMITVKDNGCGMDEATIEQVYTEFFTTKPYTKGTGFGLSQTKEIIEKEFNGTITIESALAEGTLFTIRIPLALHASTLSDSIDN